MAQDTPVILTLHIAQTTRNRLRQPADRDHRSMANMVEVLILRRCDANGISVPSPFTTANEDGPLNQRLT